MSLDADKIQKRLCSLLCANVTIRKKHKSLLQIETPFYFPDGDPYLIFLKEMPGGILRLSDMGHTMMHLSYDNDIEKFKEGTRGKIFEQIKGEFNIGVEEGEFFVETQIDNIGLNIFRLGQSLTRINDLIFLNRARAESTFYEDLQEQLFKIVSEEKIRKDYYFEEMDNSRDYPIDFRIEGKHAPLFLFGIPNRDKARLTTIILERLIRAKADFDSLLIFSDQGTIPKQDLARLSNAGGEMIASLDAETDFTRKLSRKVA
ncbi:MAG: DUF1828 domain-containing protein [Bacteroidetes bacterium]|nr:DUF1828 domain-containing protein [Bacteroidota bacterium]